MSKLKKKFLETGADNLNIISNIVEVVSLPLRIPEFQSKLDFYL